MKVLSGYSEDIICSHLCAYVRLKYPGVLFCHIPNEGSGGNAIRGAKLKRQGVRRGMCDYLFFGRGHDGSNLLALEVKREKGILSKYQKEVLEQLGEQEGYQAWCAWGYDASIDVLEKYFNGRQHESRQRKQQF
jgi:hypothetical protein